MYLKSVTLCNFRKFGTTSNTLSFVSGQDLLKNPEAPSSINIAESTTLIVGKNNSGKTTIVIALEKLVNTQHFLSTDFNFLYLKNILERYIKTPGVLDDVKSDENLPFMEFKLKIGIHNKNETLLNNVSPFMTIEDVDKSEIDIIVKWELEETEKFVQGARTFIQKCKNKIYQDFIIFDKFLELLDESKFALNFYDENKEKIKINKTQLKSLITIVSVKANNIPDESALSNAFKTIIKFRFENLKKKDSDAAKDEFEQNLMDVNKKLTDYIATQHTNSINDSIRRIVSSQKYQIMLKSDLTLEKLLNTVVKYLYHEGGYHIPENQFGLGYTNLMMIISEIIKYMELYHDNVFNSQINIISIEEPETFMHPQMQEHFIKNINETLSVLISKKQKHVNSQIIITSHSPHILHSKIHESDSFDNINYITEFENHSYAIPISDKSLEPSDEASTEATREANSTFLKRHIKFEMSTLFFADAVILVEGITEYTLLRYYLDKHPLLNQYYISIVYINGNYAKVYEQLIHLLRIPTIIITDLDIKREDHEKNISNDDETTPCFLQIDSTNIRDRETTSDTLSYFKKEKCIEKIVEQDYYKKDNLMLTTQKDEISGYYATSFEEAMILSNENNAILKNTLQAVKPTIYAEIIATGGVIKNSFQLQSKLRTSKTDFANVLLYNILTKDNRDELPILPKYISDAFDFIIERLK